MTWFCLRGNIFISCRFEIWCDGVVCLRLHSRECECIQNGIAPFSSSTCDPVRIFRLLFIIDKAHPIRYDEQLCIMSEFKHFINYYYFLITDVKTFATCPPTTLQLSSSTNLHDNVNVDLPKVSGHSHIFIVFVQLVTKVPSSCRPALLPFSAINEN